MKTTTLALLLAAVLVAGRAFAGAAPEVKTIASEDARKLAEERRVRAAQAKKEELMRLCRVKPVMSDGEVDACRVAYRELGERSK
jgi:hypothetical protein